MTGATIAKKAAGICLRCTKPAAETSVLCRPHADDLAARVRKSTTKTRAARRASKLCAYCGKPSASYGCGDCKPKQLTLTMEVRP